MKSIRQQAGDTMVEVLIAMAILSFVLSGAYAVTNRTLANSRQAQERGEALQLATQQLELLSRFVATATVAEIANLKSTGSPRCVQLENDSLFVTDPGDECISTDEIEYRTSFRYVTVAGQNHYEVTVGWPAATGNGDDNLNLVYRPYEP
jgi:prepilin-type N-terminal cleavage/methylation domain-containing protein